jgi:hypothetical protein
MSNIIETIQGTMWWYFVRHEAFEWVVETAQFHKHFSWFGKLTALPVMLLIVTVASVMLAAAFTVVCIVIVIVWGIVALFELIFFKCSKTDKQ